MSINQDSLEQFLLLSADLTDFEQVELLGTGMAELYYQQVVSVVGIKIADELWATTRKLSGLTGKELESAIRREIMANPKFGAIARNIIQLWYWGSWIELPDDWRSRYGISQNDITNFVGAAGYQEGLIWKVMSSHPEGTKQPGFGSWSMLPGSALNSTNEHG